MFATPLPIGGWEIRAVFLVLPTSSTISKRPRPEGAIPIRVPRSGISPGLVPFDILLHIARRQGWFSRSSYHIRLGIGLFRKIAA